MIAASPAVGPSALSGENARTNTGSCEVKRKTKNFIPLKKPQNLDDAESQIIPLLLHYLAFLYINLMTLQFT